MIPYYIEDIPSSIVIDLVNALTFDMDATGTKIAAATTIGMNAAASNSEPVQEQYQTVHLDRPFVYLIVDRSSNLPLFTGVVLDVGR